MTLSEFRASVKNATPPAVGPALLALWRDARGEWDAAHDLAQQVGDDTGAWVHAYLHRKEGDVGNAGYWYEQARKTPATGSLEAEWELIASELLASAEYRVPRQSA